MTPRPPTTTRRSRPTAPPGADTANDSDLAAALATDLDEAFGRLVDTHGSVVYTLVARSVGAADAEDLTAEALSRAYRALRTWPPGRVAALQVRPWLVTIALNVVRNHHRAVARRPALVPLDSGDDPRGAAVDHDAGADDGIDLAGLVARLPERQRTAVVLRHVSGLSFEEVAAAMGCPVGTAKSHASRGVEGLRSLLAPGPGAVSATDPKTPKTPKTPSTR